MFSRLRDQNEIMRCTNGTSLMGEIKLVYSDIVLAFGQPDDADEYKISGEWVFYNSLTSEVYTLYDWKSTNLYDKFLPSVSKFRLDTKPQTFHIGGNRIGDVDEFILFLKQKIQYAKVDKIFENEVLLSKITD